MMNRSFADSRIQQIPTTAGHSLSARVAGTIAGDPTATVILDASLGAGKSMWEPVADELLALEPGIRLVAYDRAGMGLSGAPRDNRHVDDMINDALCVIDAQAVDGVPLILVGHFLGGLIARMAALKMEKMRRPPDGVILIEPGDELFGWSTDPRTVALMRSTTFLSRISDKFGMFDVFASASLPEDLPHRKLMRLDTTGKAYDEEARAFFREMKILSVQLPPMPESPAVLIASSKSYGEFVRARGNQITVVDAGCGHIVPLRAPILVADYISVFVNNAINARGKNNIGQN
ncbi:alpha/beta hydrolase [Corynebacterium mendelii]|uniref:Alpha/beta hydrolase n=1 Tax=Corynebacterium mendelii TaxID=2765362 RepID=A0A939DYF7_9CORY|nr:alpha/beta hydrolase [Corynebacterium mendelii]MBN9643540.1 alpha/beta hydrolase [Corynebacterium mendelii]